MKESDMAAEKLQCMEILGSNQTSQRYVEGPGLTAWLESRQLGGGSGGDIHYLSTCGSGDLFRIILADVAGHGMEVDAIAQRLRGLMRKYINTFDQTCFAKALNDAMLADDQTDRFATAVLLTYFNPTHHLVICNAGHPRPLWYNSRTRDWTWLDEQAPAHGEPIRQSRSTYHLRSIANIPLGILEPTDYLQFAVQLSPGDLAVLYTDGVTDTLNQQEENFGETKLLEAVRQIGPLPARELGPALSATLDRWQGDSIAPDDRTVVVVEHTATRPPISNPVRITKTLLKMLGMWKV